VLASTRPQRRGTELTGKEVIGKLVLEPWEAVVVSDNPHRSDG